MKQHTGDEIRTIMTEMPIALVEALQAGHVEHKITEREARWWGYLMYARNEAYEGESYTIKVLTGEDVPQHILPYVLQGRAGDDRVGMVRRPWPDGGCDFIRNG